MITELDEQDIPKSNVVNLDAKRREEFWSDPCWTNVIPSTDKRCGLCKDSFAPCPECSGVFPDDIFY